MFSGEAQTVGEKYRVVQHGKDRHEQAPDAVPDIIAVDLRAGGEAAAEMGGEPYEGYAEKDGG